ncbi:MAG: BMC domain-containing protein [Verrucomicrobiota bacterium]|jgi:microcompartment protein CcmL/EutN
MALGLLEIPFLGVTLLVGDQVVKAAGVRLLGFESPGNGSMLIRLEGEVAAVQAALQRGKEYAASLGAKIVSTCLTRPEDGFTPMIQFPNAQNPLYQGRDQFLPSDFPATKQKTMNTKDALGIIETQGLTAVLEAADAMLKAANVTLVGKEKIGAAYVTVIVRGDVAAVTAAVDAGSKAVGALGKLVAAHVISRPHDDLAALLPK